VQTKIKASKLVELAISEMKAGGAHEVNHHSVGNNSTDGRSYWKPNMIIKDL
jgi:hypothetical protein